MNILRTAGLLGAAFMTMGSGGVVKASGEQPATALEPEYVDESQAADAAATPSTSAASTSGSTGDEALIDADGLTSADAGTVGAGIPKTAAQMADEGKAVEIAFSDDYIQGRYYTGKGLLGFDNATGHIGAYISDNRDIIANVGLMTDSFPLIKQIKGLNLSVGARGYVALLSDPNDDVVGLAPGIQARYGLPYDFGFPLAVAGDIFYSPDVLTLGDANSIIDVDGRVEAEFITDIVGFVGYRLFTFDSDEGSNTNAANEIQIGARFRL